MADIISAADLWRGLELYYNMGLSMIWSRAEKEIVSGKERAPKTPIGNWKAAQTKRFSLEFLATVMNKTRVQLAPTIVCGAVSGNLEVIDLDVKHWPEIDVLFFTEVKALYPDLFEKLRIHRTQSGGMHVLYRCIEPIPVGNKKLAVRAGSKEAGIETRGEGGYILCPPGVGYTVHKDVPIPVLTMDERNILIVICKLFDQRAKEIVQPKTKQFDSVYDENPFQHFNSSTMGQEILLDYGWKLHQETSSYIHFTRPGKETDVSASFIKEKRIFHIFTTSTALEGEKNYTPSAVVALLDFNGDYKKLYRHLVTKGFGKVKPDVERKTVAKLAAAGAPIPPNYSPEAKEIYAERISKQEERFPYGTFWTITEDAEEFTIKRPLLVEVCTGLGLATYKGNPIVIKRPFFKKLKSEREAYDIVLAYIQDDEHDIYLNIVHAFDKYWEKSGKWTLSRLMIIEREHVLRSTFHACYKVFDHQLVTITGEGISVARVDANYDKLIDSSSVISRPWKEVTDYESCMYADYLNKACGIKGRDLMKVIGYLAYDYKDETEGYVIALLEETESRKGGGTGKGLFCQLLGFWTKVKTIDGDMILKKELLLQSWDGERVLHLNDLPRKANLSSLKALATEGTERKVLYKNIETVEPDEMPKIVVSGQFGINTFDDGGVGRRFEIVPFTSFFNANNRPIDVYGGKLPDVWKERDWNGFFTLIAKAIVEYMGDRKIQLDKKMKDETWEKNFDFTYSMGSEELREWIEDRVDTWKDLTYVTSEDLQNAYDQFCREQNIKNDMRIRRLHEAIEAWCDRHGYDYEHGKKKRIADKTYRVSSINKRGVIVQGELELEEAEVVEEKYDERGRPIVEALPWEEDDTPDGEVVQGELEMGEMTVSSGEDLEIVPGGEWSVIGESEQSEQDERGEQDEQEDDEDEPLF